MAPVVEEPVDPSDELMFLCLGGGNEVGRSCHILQYKGKTVMVRNIFHQQRTRELIVICNSSMLVCIPVTKGLPLSHSMMISTLALLMCF